MQPYYINNTWDGEENPTRAQIVEEILEKALRFFDCEDDTKLEINNLSVSENAGVVNYSASVSFTDETTTAVTTGVVLPPAVPLTQLEEFQQQLDTQTGVFENPINE